MLTVALLAVAAVVAWNVLRWPAVRAGGGLRGQTVSILIPARDEEANLAACLDSALAQDAAAEIIVYDDHSRDRTAALVLEYAARDARLRLAPTEPLPPGWCGKTFACWRLAALTRSEWLLFLDADARLAPGAVTAMVAEAERRGATLLSCWPGFEMRGFAEGLLMPLLNFFVFTLFPAPLSLRRAAPSLGLAHGACMLARADAYARTGGHGVVAADLFEDTRLARLWRERGEWSLCLDGSRVVRVRMYSGFSGIWNGFRKNFRPAFRREWSFWAFLAMHAGLFLLPFVTARPAALLVIAMRLMLAARFRHPLWSALLHPLGEAVAIALGVASWRACRRGGVTWKGRRYQPACAPR